MKAQSAFSDGPFTDADYKRTSALESDFKPFKNFDDPRFGEIVVLQNPRSRQIIFAKDRKTNDKPEVERWVRAARKRMARDDPYTLQLLDYSVLKKSELCSSFFIFRLFFEYPKNDLKKELAGSPKTGPAVLTSAQMTHILYQLMTALAAHQARGYIHGDLQPMYIAWDRQQVEAKLIENPVEDVDWVKFIQIQKGRLVAGSPLYQSPVMYGGLKRGSLKFTYDPKREEAFALGLILLEAGLGRSVQGIYGRDQDELNKQRLDSLLAEFEQKFAAENTLLASSVGSLLTWDEHDRPTVEVILANIPTYQEVTEYLKGMEEGGYGQDGQPVTDSAAYNSSGSAMGTVPNQQGGARPAPPSQRAPVQSLPPGQPHPEVQYLEQIMREQMMKERQQNYLEQYQARTQGAPRQNAQPVSHNSTWMPPSLQQNQMMQPPAPQQHYYSDANVPLPNGQPMAPPTPPGAFQKSNRTHQVMSAMPKDDFFDTDNHIPSPPSSKTTSQFNYGPASYAPPSPQHFHTAPGRPMTIQQQIAHFSNQYENFFGNNDLQRTDSVMADAQKMGTPQLKLPGYSAPGPSGPSNGVQAQPGYGGVAGPRP